jgi:adenylate kinase family enzyme
MHTEPALEYFKSIGRLVEINGEQTIEEVHQDIIKAIKL